MKILIIKPGCSFSHIKELNLRSDGFHYPKEQRGVSIYFVKQIVYFLVLFECLYLLSITFTSYMLGLTVVSIMSRYVPDFSRDPQFISLLLANSFLIVYIFNNLILNLL